jgi:hypothetical protein
MRTAYFLMFLLCSSFFLPASAETLSSGKKIYQQYCAGCHDTGTANAPRRDDVAHWKKRFSEARSALTDAVITGKGAMPAKGGCATCTEEMLNNAMLYLIGTAYTPSSTPPSTTLPLDKIKLPEGFSISIFAKDLPGARFMARGDKGTLFVGTRSNDKVYALVPTAPGKPPRKNNLTQRVR